MSTPLKFSGLFYSVKRLQVCQTQDLNQVKSNRTKTLVEKEKRSPCLYSFWSGLRVLSSSDLPFYVDVYLVDFTSDDSYSYSGVCSNVTPCLSPSLSEENYLSPS